MAVPFTVKNKCPINDCEFMGYITQLPLHVKSVHPKNYLNNDVKVDATRHEGTRVFLLQENEVVFVIKLRFADGNLRVHFECLHFQHWVDNTFFVITLHETPNQEMFHRKSGNLAKKSEVNLAVKHEVFYVHFLINVQPPLLLYYASSRERITCGVCKLVMGVPIYYCIDGRHMVCANCVGFKKYCSICDMVSYLERLPLMENLALMLQTKCAYSNKGCLFEGCTIDVNLHEVDCIYRQPKCPICEWVGPKNNFPEHFKLEHQKITLDFLNRFSRQLQPGEEDSTEAILFSYGMMVEISIERKKDKEGSLKLKLRGPAALEPFFSVVVHIDGNSENLICSDERELEYILSTYSIDKSAKSVMIELKKHD